MRTEMVCTVVAHPAARAGLRCGLAMTLALALVGPAVSCKSLQRPLEQEGPRGQLIEGGELPILMTRLGQYPRRFVTSAERVAVRFYFDPQLVDVAKVKSYTLWSLDGSTRTWNKVATVPASEGPLEIEPEEGVIGLRASVTLLDNREKLQPSAKDEPSVWLCVDRSPPSISWISPRAQAPISGVRSLDLQWATNEVQFARDAKIRLAWSADRGRSWKPIADLPVVYGPQSYTWKLPREVVSDVLVRATAVDLAGHEADAVLGLSYPGSVGSGEPALALDTPLEPAPAGAEKKELPADRREGPAEGSTTSTAGQAAPPGDEIAGAAPAPVNGEAVSAQVASVGEPGAAPRTGEGASKPGPSSSPGEGQSLPVAGDPGESGPATPGQQPAVVNEGTSPRSSATDTPGVRAIEPVVPAPLEIVSSPSGLLAPGAPVSLAWRVIKPATAGAGGEVPTAQVAVETSTDRGRTWIPVGKAPLAQEKLEWTLPQASATDALVRALVELPGGGRPVVEARATYSIDADPPRIALVDLPEVLGGRSTIKVDANDEGGTGVAGVKVFLRRAGAPEWRPLSTSSASLEGDAIALDLTREPEDAFDLWVVAADRAGNLSAGAPSSPAGAETSSAFGHFRLDRTAPSITARATPAPWVAGFQAEMLVDVDWTDGVPPLVLEGQDSGGNWVELGRWASVSPDQNSFQFLVPAGVAAYTVRFSVADLPGNRALQVVGPHAVEPAVRLATFTETRAYTAGDSEKVSWKLHPMAAESAEDLKIQVGHQPKHGAEWLTVYDGLPAHGECYWDLPRADAEEHRLRVRLLRKGKVLGEDVSAVFKINGPDRIAPTVVRIKEDSLFESKQAQSLAQKHQAAVEAGSSGSAELDRLKTQATASFEKALAIDPSNYQATYGMAQFLNRVDSGSKQIIPLLERTLAIKPDHFWALNDLGAAYIRDGNYARAEEALRKSVAIEASPVALYNLGLSLLFGSKPAEARERLEAALKAGRAQLPEGEVSYYLIQCHLQEGNVERARGLFREKEAVIPADLQAELKRAL